MPSIKRRHFLQFAGSALASMGLSQTDFLRQANQYGKVLAQGTPRKLALLVGINQYPGLQGENLSGCVHDVEMHQQLLIHRFGFNPSDMLVLTDDTPLKPTRANILQAFEEHLIAQARPGDVVVFHYSGHGALVKDPNPITVAQCGTEQSAGLNGTLVPRDASFANHAGDDLIVPDIMGRSLFLLTQRINTDNVTMVLDSCFSGAGTRGNARVRAVDRLTARSELTLVPSPEELENQERWLRDLGITNDQFQARRAAGIARGLALGSASCNQEAYEMPFDGGYTAGAFSYLLTSYLWQGANAELAETVKVNLIRSTRLAAREKGPQVPIFEEAPGSGNLKKPIYFTQAAAPFADAVVRTVTGEQIELWLGGVSSATLKTVRPGTVYSLLDAAGNPGADVVIESRRGLYAYGKLVEQSARQAVTVQPGALLREKLLAIPNPTLRIGVDASLGAEKAAAEAALQTGLQRTSGSSTGSSSPSRITVLPINQQNDLDYILARTTDTIRDQLAPDSDQPPWGRSPSSLPTSAVRCLRRLARWAKPPKRPCVASSPASKRCW